MVSRDVRHLVGEDPGQDLRRQQQRLGTNQQPHAITAVADPSEGLDVYLHFQRRDRDARGGRKAVELVG